MIKVRITGTVITAQYGTLSAGDILTTNEDFAKHLVEECAAAKYLSKADSELESGAQAERKPAAKSKKSV